MALLNHFDDIVDERSYVRDERLSRRIATRALLGIAILLFLIFAILNPNFFPDQDMTAYNITTFLMIVILVLGFYLTGTKYYLEWRPFDVVLFVFSIISMAALTAIMAGMKVDPISTFRRMASANVNALYVYGSIVFVANFRYFLYSVLALTLFYMSYLAISGIETFEIITVAASLVVYLSFAVFVNWVIDQHAREVFATEKQLKLERKKSENLLYKVLPEAVAKRLRAGESVADFFDEVTVIFVDIVNSSALARELSPAKLVEQLNRFFLIADQCADRYGIEKVKTIGDAYLAVSGGTASAERGASAAVDFGRELITEMREVARVGGIDIKLRVGIHSGPVVGGVVGSSRLAYDYWGDTMNIASRIENVAEPNSIAVSAATYFQCNGSHAFTQAEILALKGVGDTEIYRLKV